MPLADGALLEARGLVRRYGRTTILAGLDLSVAAGECLLLLGTNGVGKSTLLRTLAGLARPEAGSVTIGGAAVKEARHRLGYLAHDTLLYDDLTVTENLAFAAELQGRAYADVVPAAIEAARLGEHRHRLVRHLSRGLAQRTALARALLHAPPVLLLDEPYTGLDAKSAADLTAFLVDYVAGGCAIVLVGHRPDEGWEAVTRVAVLARGKWAFDAPRPATPAEMVTRYREVLDG